MGPPDAHMHTTNSHQGDMEQVATPCNCSNHIQQIMREIQDNSTMDFETFVNVGTRFAHQCEAFVSCQHCRIDYNAFASLWPTLERILVLYEAACAAYSFTSLDLGGDAPDQGQHPRDHHREANGTTVNKIASQKNVFISRPTKISWGGFELKGEEVKLLVKVLLRRRHAALGSILDELHEMLMTQWEVSWPRQRTSLTACETSYATSVERLDSLMGLLK